MPIDTDQPNDPWRRFLVSLLRTGIAGAWMLAALACASSGGGGGGEGACGFDLTPYDGSLSEVLDSAALQRDLADVDGGYAGLVLAEVHYDSLAAYDTTYVWSESLSDASRAEVGAAIAKAAPPELGADGSFHLFVGDADGPAVRRVGEFQLCGPRLRHERDLRVQLRRKAFGLGLDRAHLTCTLIHVGPDGRVDDVRIAKSSGRWDVDAAVMEVLHGASFHPGYREGMRVDVWVSFPVTLSVMIERRPRPGGAEGDFWYPDEASPAPPGSCSG